MIFKNEEEEKNKGFEYKTKQKIVFILFLSKHLLTFFYKGKKKTYGKEFSYQKMKDV